MTDDFTSTALISSTAFQFIEFQCCHILSNKKEIKNKLHTEKHQKQTARLINFYNIRLEFVIFGTDFLHAHQSLTGL